MTWFFSPHSKSLKVSLATGCPSFGEVDTDTSSWSLSSWHGNSAEILGDRTQTKARPTGSYRKSQNITLFINSGLTCLSKVSRDVVSPTNLLLYENQPENGRRKKPVAM